jgi:hippurate hydrolase
VEQLAKDVLPLYRTLHQHPELSGQERKTAALLAGELTKLHFDVVQGVGGTGVVGVLRNGPGPTVMLRTELDALPVEEQTGLPFASRARGRLADGRETYVAHACGHDLHMASWLASATWMVRQRASWKGTLLVVAQPAEETLSGALAMLAAGLFTRFPKPDAALAIHTHDGFPVGRVLYTLGPFAAASDSLNLTVYGRGGHGAYPEHTVDPIVIAARIVGALQTITSRERDPRDPVVVTVGSIHGGTKHNVIPDTVTLQIMVRTFAAETRTRVLAAVRRIADGEAAAAGAPRSPELATVEQTEVTHNDPALTRLVLARLTTLLGADALTEIPKELGAEDFGTYGREGVPSVYLGIGAVDPKRHAAARAGGPSLAAQHSGQFAPDLGALRVAIQVEISALLTLLAR